MSIRGDEVWEATPWIPPEVRERRRRFWSRFFAVVFIATLPLTVLALWSLTFVHIWREEVDVPALMAISVGILGVLVFFIFLYKYQMIAELTDRERWWVLGLHALVTLMLFLGCIWLAFDSPWSTAMVWGNYDMQSVAKSWIIAVLVVGTISWLGSFFDLIRKRLGGG
ncbi:MAG TPA: hypothetical protein PK916_15340 [Bacteroidota bacterium]|nr:hypothetical protein [Bacteroidota bacterium]